jgi:sugar/nucleoside kinase (ribokinase family)
MVKGFTRIDCMKLATAAAVLSIACYGGEADYESFNEVLEFSKRVPLIKKYFLN